MHLHWTLLWELSERMVCVVRCSKTDKSAGTVHLLLLRVKWSVCWGERTYPFLHTSTQLRHEPCVSSLACFYCPERDEV
jgi:hypothetical protein